MNTTLWYEAPASSFCDALPVGNGSLGAVVYGGVPEECMSLNLDTLWSGTGRRMEQKIAKHVLEDVKKQCAQEHYFEAQNLIERKMLGQYNESYMPLGSFRYHYYGIENVENYRRELDLEEAVVRTEFTCAGRQYQSEVFVSNPDHAMVVHLVSETKMKIDFWLESKLQTISTIQRENSQMISGNAPSHVDPNYVESENPIVYMHQELGMPFCCQMHVDTVDGDVSCVDGKIQVRDAREIRILITAADGYRKGSYDMDPSIEHCFASCEQYMNRVKSRTYQQIRSTHRKDYQALFERSRFQLETEGREEIPLNQRLKRIKRGETDLGLYCLYYHFNRYLLISSSRPGSQPANLQGIWSESTRPVWSSNWTININTEMNYWPAGICNLSECFEPLLCMLEEMSEAGKETAKNYFHCRGWVANHNVDIWRQTEPVAGLAKYAYWPMGGVSVSYTHLTLPTIA